METKSKKPFISKIKFLNMTINKLFWILSSLIVTGVITIITLTYQNRSDIIVFKTESQIRYKQQELLIKKVEDMNRDLDGKATNKQLEDMSKAFNEKVESVRKELVAKIDNIGNRLERQSVIKKFFGNNKVDTNNVFYQKLSLKNKNISN